MTSMLLIVRSAAVAGCGAAVIAASAFLPAVARRDLLLGGVLAGLFLHHLAHHRAIARHEGRERLEALAVPLLELDHAGALVVEAAGLHRREQPGGAELLETRFGQIEVLEAPAHLLGR